MKSEKEKMISGKPYKAFGDELLAERQYAKEMIFDFNSLRPNQIDERNEILKRLLGKTKELNSSCKCNFSYF
jgi:maltose O-acetyltransferase